MNTKEFVDFYAELNQITKKQATEEVERFSETFKTAALENDKINLTGFIKSEITERKARDGINPQTKEKIKIPAKKIIKVSAQSKFKNMLEE